MCYKDEDEELWQEDPYEYIRMKFGECLMLKNDFTQRWDFYWCFCENRDGFNLKKKPKKKTREREKDSVLTK